MKKNWILFILSALFVLQSHAQSVVNGYHYPTYKGLVMAGYQGWFNTSTDGAGRMWHHFQRRNVFAPGSCEIDLWPDMTEYEKQYPTDFKFSDGKTATVFSA